MKFSVSLLGLDRLVDRDVMRMISFAALAEERGLDQVVMPEHMIMGQSVDRYPYGTFALRLDDPWYEPLVVLAAVAAATTRVEVSTAILISPLRPAITLAKELATLDVLSRGRVVAGLGVGWQKEEFDAAGVPWEGRFSRLIEQIEVCHALWQGRPTSYHGKTVNFDDLVSLPAPARPSGIPILLGLAASEQNVKRIAKHADGWLPMERDPIKLGEPISRIHRALIAEGRDPEAFVVRAIAPTSYSQLDSDDFTAHVRALQQAGVTNIQVVPGIQASSLGEAEDMLDQVRTVQHRLLSD